MFDFDSLIGIEVQKAKLILEDAGYKNVNIILNAEHKIECDTIIVCAVRVADDGISLVCGEFLLELKGEDL